MTIAKIMRTGVVAVRTDDVIEVARRRMRDQSFSELPVVDPTGHLVGVLSEHDLLARLAPRRMPRWWTMIFGENNRLAADYLKAVGVTVGDLMTVSPVAIVPDASVETAADLMRRHTLGALPVVVNDVCLGLVTRTDVLDHLAWPAVEGPGRVTVTDAELECLMHEAMQQELWTSRHRVTVDAMHGIVRLTGVVANAVERSALVGMARALPGCVGVENRLVVLSVAGRRQPAPVI
jgi:CBS domain-containing protein